MIKKLFLKNGRFLNSWMIILSILLISLGLIQAINPIKDNGLTFIGKIPVLFGIPMVIIGILSLVYTIFYLICSKKFNNNKLFIVKKIIYFLLMFLIAIYFVEYIVLGLVGNFIEASKLNKIPEKNQFVLATCWLLMNKGSDFLKGIGVTLSISLLGTVIGLFLGLVFAILRIQKVGKKDSEFKAFFKKIAVGFSKGYIALFRGTPMMVQAILFYYLVPFAISQATGVPMSTMNKIFTWFVSGLLVVSLNTTAYLAEVLRGGIESIDKGQMEAARSLGMGYWQAMIFVILPQALKNSMPSIGNEFVINIKDTSVLNVIGVIDIFYVSSQIQSDTFRFNEPFFIAACIYLILTFTTTRILTLIERKMDVNEKPLPSSN